MVTTYKALNGLASGYITNLIDRFPYAIPTILWSVVHWKFQVQTPFRLETPLHSALQRQNWGILKKKLWKKLLLLSLLYKCYSFKLVWHLKKSIQKQILTHGINGAENEISKWSDTHSGHVYLNSSSQFFIKRAYRTWLIIFAPWVTF